MPEADPLLSVVIPVHNEEGCVVRLAEEIGQAFAKVDYTWEVVWVNDGSTDATAERLAALKPPHRLINLDRCQGQSAALSAGFLAARGTWLGTLDGDGQNDPADLVRQLEHARGGGFDMVNGIRVSRRHSPARRLASRIANRVRNRITGDQVTDVGCSTRVIRREAALQVPFFDGMHRFLPTLVRMRGFVMTEIAVNHRPRRAGASKYGILDRLWRGLPDLFGVRWLISRQRNWIAVESVSPQVDPSTPHEPQATHEARS